ncbi:Putative Glycoside Hydrolase Family 93 [Podospora comata]|uniref:Glycoside Hydrolase Family 93 n=1 Tax=Podospora comata TaxID=48703 RepID=A0ABY6S877_PODCO|nr:Putative Glycoside Hydrolase Family 93 [Podospora comata]
MHVYIPLSQPLFLIYVREQGQFHFRVRDSLSLFTHTLHSLGFRKAFSFVNTAIHYLITMITYFFLSVLLHLLLSPLPLIAATPLLPPRSPPPTLSFNPISPPILIHPNAVYPRATTLFNLSSPTPDSPLLLTSYTTTHHSNGLKTLSASTSSHHPTQTWTFLSHIWTANASTHEIDNPFALQLPNGNMLYAFRNHDIDPLTRKYTYYRITLCVSTDFGRTWEFLSHASERAAKKENNGLWEPFLRVDGRGRVQIYYSSERGVNRQDNMLRVSGDGGRTWGEEVLVSRAGEGEESRDGMVGVAEVGGEEEGRLVCVFETTTEEEGGRRFAVGLVESFDDGETWGQGTRRRVYTARKGKDAGAPQVVSVGGVLVVSFMTNEGVSESEGGEGVDGGEMKIVLSRDGGRRWEGVGDGNGEGERAAVAAGRGSHWPGLFRLDDRRFLGLYSANGAGAVSRVFEIKG